MREAEAKPRRNGSLDQLPFVELANMRKSPQRSLAAGLLYGIPDELPWRRRRGRRIVRGWIVRRRIVRRCLRSISERRRVRILAARGTGNPMPLRVHALLECIIVAALGSVGRSLGRTGACSSADRQAGCGTDARSTGVAANRRAGRGANQRSKNGASRTAVGNGLIGGGAADLVVRIVTALIVIGAELVERPAVARQHHEAA